MRLNQLWRTTTFRLSVLYGMVFALATVALLGMVYLQSAVYLTHRVDVILDTEAAALEQAPAPVLTRRIGEALALNGGRTNVFALFSPSGVRIAGNLRALPKGLDVAGKPVEIAPTADFPANARLMARRLPSGDELVVGRDVDQLREMRAIIASALIWSGLLIILAGLACGVALSVAPLRRLQLLQAVGHDIAAGDLKRRMPTSQRGDELDMFAATVNHMIGEVERLMSEVKGATESIAHDLRTPLTRARAQLDRLARSPSADASEIARVIAELDEVLDRFRAILRISELELRERQAGFSPTDLGALVEQIVELYQPLAEEHALTLSGTARAVVIRADPKLLFEAVSNLVDNAIKFGAPGGTVEVRAEGGRADARIVVEDDGPGIPPADRTAVLQRFYRNERDRLVPGSGLGLSIVAAIVRLHRFGLELQDAEPGLRVVIDCSETA